MILVLNSSTSNIKSASKQIINNNLVAFPTETVYGLGGSAYSDIAINKIYALKKRPLQNPLSVHYLNLNHIAEDCEVNEICKLIYKKFMPGALTIILKKKTSTNLKQQSSVQLATQGIRVSSHPVARALIKYAQVPIVAPSANMSNKISPTLAQHVINSFANSDVTLLDGGESTLGLESTIIDISNNKNITILRHGPITQADLQTLDIPIISKTTAVNPAKILQQHYSPNTPLYLDCHDLKANDGLLAFGKINFSLPSGVFVYNLSTTANLQEAASNFFKALWQLDAKKLNKICVMPIPNQGLGVAINEKLQKAACKSTSN